MVDAYKMFIGGQWVDAYSKETFDVINPATEEVIAKVPLGNQEDAKAAIDAAREAFDSGVWSDKTPAERSSVLWKFADLIEKEADHLAHTLSKNVGKTLRYARNSDLPFIIDNLRFFAGAARVLEGKGAANYSGLGTSIIKREPLGVCAAICPWNYPLYIENWKIGPALAAGNTVVVKSASYTPLTLLEIMKRAAALFPKGVVNVVCGPGGSVGTELARNKNVDKISFTGDEKTGIEIMKNASTNVKEVELELGGKAPFVVLEDANVEAAAEAAVISGFWNTGQDCTATTRIYVHKKLHEKFVKRLVEKTSNIRLGDPLSPKTDLGPLISKKQLDRVISYVESGVSQGAKLVAGGKKPSNIKKGFYFEPTIFDKVEQDMKICQDEIFGPVLSVLPFSTIDEAVDKANDVVYGLAGSVWGSDIVNTTDVADRLDFGTVWINDHGVLVSEMPHGGFKRSGFGKDLSMYSFDEYTRIKHIYIDQSGLVRKPWYDTVFGEKK